MKAAGRLRIGGGARRGLEIQVPSGARPTSARLREALFNIWADRLESCRFLDLFAGSGAVGIEAASRGAARALLVEADRSGIALIKRNVQRAALAGVQELHARLPGDLARHLAAEERFDLVFADPPYGFAEFGPLLGAVEPFLAADGEVAVEHSWRDGEPATVDALQAVRSRRYGDSGLTIFRRPG